MTHASPWRCCRPSDLCCKLKDTLGRAERFMTQLQSPATALIPLRFCFSWCQIACRARTMSLASLHLHLTTNGSPKPPSWSHSKSLSPSMVGSEHRLPSRKGGFGIRDPVLHSPAPFFLGLKQQHGLPLQQPRTSSAWRNWTDRRQDCQNSPR